MKELSILLALFFLISITSNAQIGDTVITHDKGRVYEVQGNNYFTSILRDFDSLNTNWLTVERGKNPNSDDYFFDIYKVDNELNILDSIKTEAQNLSVKYNNRIYGLGFDSKNVFPKVYLDSITLYCKDINGNNLIKKLIYTYDSDTLKFLDNKFDVFFTNDNNIALFMHCENDSNFQLSKLFIIDTSGNIIKNKTYRLNGKFVSDKIVERWSNYEILSTTYANIFDTGFTMLRIIDKNTLEVNDSIVFDSTITPLYFKYINDSIFITMNSDFIDSLNKEAIRINIVNRNSLIIKSIVYPTYKDDFAYLGSLDYFFSFAEKLVFINPDSIYFAYYSSIAPPNQSGNVNPSSYTNHSIRIINFGINGNINFYYNFDFDSTQWKQVNGVKATSDGGIIIAYVTFTESGFIKFMPNGFVGLSNVESGERASLRVYPNPAKDFVLVDIEADKFDEADIEIYDLGGRMVKSSKLSAKVGNRIDVSSLRAGVYGYRVVLNGKGVSGKIVVGE